MNARLLDEGPHHAVFWKPAGMVVVAGRGVPRPTLLDVAIEMFGNTVRPVHRIDRVTSGLCIIAKTTFGQQALSEAFRRHLVDKRYVCVVQGAPAWTNLNVDARLAREDDPDARKGPLAWATVDPENGVRALTRFTVLARSGTAALLEARPETGRMHQIRIHASHVGHPLVGDTLYGAKLAYPEEKAVALVALCVSFPLPTGGRAFVTGDVSEAFAKCASDQSLSLSSLDALRAKFKASATASPPPRAPKAHARPSGASGGKRAGPARGPSSPSSPSAGGPKKNKPKRKKRGWA